MKSKMFTIILLLLVLPVLVNAQNKKSSILHKAPVVVEQNRTGSSTNTNSVMTPPDGNYVVIDSMGNVFGGAEGSINPFAFDPYSGVLAFCHRGQVAYGSGGEIWYDYSTDFGLTWTRAPQAINASSTNKGARYPSMAISNATKGDISATTGLFSWPNLNPGTFGFLGYGLDQPLGAGSTASFIDEGIGGGTYSSNAPCWTDDKTGRMFWTATMGDSAFLALFYTDDFATVTKVVPPTWSGAEFSDNGQIEMGGVSYNGVQYVGVFAPFADYNDPFGGISSGWYAGYSKSTDNGATWSTWKVADFRAVPRLANFDRLFDYKKGDTYISYQGDIQVDKNGHVHLVFGVTDTLTNKDDGTNAIIDMFETSTGWDGYVVANNLNPDAYMWGPGLGQMGEGCFVAMDSTRTIEGVQWLNSGTGDSHFADVYFAHRNISDTAFSTAMNLTNSPNINNSQAHLAPFMQSTTTGLTSTVVAFSNYAYVSGATGPFSDTATTTIAYGGRVEFTSTVTGINDKNNTVKSFALDQNYPNPFNPSTKINFSIAERGNVTLKVYDLLGREVATLINGEKEVGTYSVPFNASKLASGLYIYTLKAGSNSISKKMMLMK